MGYSILLKYITKYWSLQNRHLKVLFVLSYYQLTFCRKTIPRSTMAYFHTSGLTDFKDGVGNSLPLSVDSTMKPTSGATAARAELADAHLEPHQIAVQFLGFKQ